ncbi:MAG TPA: carboxypeptidase regulatory-like domain-containing protein, partial [Jatrophihabitans sp.]|nr:carboxypeptidase regulatory-like domain-containing protein [Jatrophihabitans sp.]
MRPTLLALAVVPALLASGIPAAGAAPAGPATHASPSASGHRSHVTARPALKPAPARPAPKRPARPTDTTPPGAVSGLHLTGNSTSSVTLAWTLPADADLAHVVIRRAAGQAPPAAGQGTLVATLGRGRTGFTDTGLAANTAYGYSAVTVDRAGNQSAAATTTVATAATDARTGLRGTLTDAQGHGIGNVLVDIRLGSTTVANAVTSRSGAYKVIDLSPGTYSVCYEPQVTVEGKSATGYLADCYQRQPFTRYSTTTPVTVKAGAITAGVDDTLAVAGAAAGRVTGPDGAPVAGVIVSETDYSTNRTFEVTTLADGSFLLKNLDPRSGHRLNFDPSQATGPMVGYMYGSGDAFGVQAGAVTTADYVMNTGGIITGIVRDPAGNPVAGVAVQDGWGGNPALTDSTGRYRFTGLTPYASSYDICADGSALPPTASAPYGYLNGCNLGSTSVTVQYNQTVTVDLTLSPAAALGGTLTHADGTPVVDGQVFLSYPEGYAGPDTRTDAQGHWQLQPTPGQYYLCYTQYQNSDLWTCHGGQARDGGQGAGDLVTVTGGQLTTVNDSMLPGASIAGTVTDAAGAPLAGITVNIDDEAGYAHLQAWTDADGHYTADGLAPGSYRVCFYPPQPQDLSSPGYVAQCHGATADDPSPYAVPITAPGQQVTVDAQLAAGSAIAGTVTDAAGNPVSGVPVRLTGPSAPYWPVYTGMDGTYSYSQLQPGDYTVCFDASSVYGAPATGYVSSCWHDQLPGRAATPVITEAGQVTQGIDGTLATGGEITGTVTDGTGSQLGGIGVLAEYPDGTV